MFTPWGTVYKDPLPILAQREDLRGLCRLPCLQLSPLRAGDDLPGVALALKLRGHRRKLTLYGFAAPPVRRVPAAREAGLSPAPADTDLVEVAPVRLDRVKFVAAMARADLNVMQLSDKAGVSRGTITAVRTGQSCSQKTANKLAAVLGADILQKKA